MLYEAQDIFSFAEMLNSYSMSGEIRFQEKFKELEEYLITIIEDNHTNIMKEIKMDDKLSLSEAKAKEYFKNSAYEIIRSLKSKYEENCLYLCVPFLNLCQIIDKTKADLLSAYEKLNTNILEDYLNPNSKKISHDGEKTDKKYRKGKTKIPKKALLILKNWLTEHFNDPYPNFKEKQRLSAESGITLKQVQNWFTNARGRIWRKTCNQDKFLSLVEGRLLENEKRNTEILNQDPFI